MNSVARTRTPAAAAAVRRRKVESRQQERTAKATRKRREAVHITQQRSKSTDSTTQGNNFVKMARSQRSLDIRERSSSRHGIQRYLTCWHQVVAMRLSASGKCQTRRAKRQMLLPFASTSQPHRARTSRHWTGNPDGTLLASGSYDGIVRLWTPQGDLHLVMSMHQGPVLSVRWNRKGTMLLTGSADGTIIVWDLNSGKPRYHSLSTVTVSWMSSGCPLPTARSSPSRPQIYRPPCRMVSAVGRRHLLCHVLGGQQHQPVQAWRAQASQVLQGTHR